MHAAFCSDGDDMCGGPFKHTLSEANVISAFINSITCEGVVADTEHGDSAAHPLDCEGAVAYMEHGDSAAHPLDVDATASASPAPQANARPARKSTGKRRKTAPATRKGKKKAVEAADTDDQVCHDFHVPFSHSFIHIRAQQVKLHLNLNKFSIRRIRRRMGRNVEHHATSERPRFLGGDGRLHHQKLSQKTLPTRHLHYSSHQATQPLHIAMHMRMSCFQAVTWRGRHGRNLRTRTEIHKYSSGSQPGCSFASVRSREWPWTNRSMALSFRKIRVS
jgi:hypothetical protein